MLVFLYSLSSLISLLLLSPMIKGSGYFPGLVLSNLSYIVLSSESNAISISSVGFY